MTVEWDQAGHYQTADGDRVSLLRLGGEWAVCWAYGYPHESLRLISYGEAMPAAIDAFVSSREGKQLMYDSRMAWQSGSV
ncbi:hypothetical protein [Streptomyces sp. NPDC021020]|uniref:hypothetical protein n=1 Tax=Streptomyces sp. NPDC021020 TaxID=3365109 RepID=UPI00378E60BC